MLAFVRERKKTFLKFLSFKKPEKETGLHRIFSPRVSREFRSGLGGIEEFDEHLSTTVQVGNLEDVVVDLDDVIAGLDGVVVGLDSVAVNLDGVVGDLDGVAVDENLETQRE